MKELIFSRSAAQDLISALSYAKSVDMSLASQLWLTLESDLEHIRRFPSAYTEISTDSHVRRMSMSKVPYSVYYVESNERILVIALLHHRRDADAIIRKRV